MPFYIDHEKHLIRCSETDEVIGQVKTIQIQSDAIYRENVYGGSYRDPLCIDTNRRIFVEMEIIHRFRDRTEKPAPRQVTEASVEVFLEPKALTHESQT